MAYTPYDRRQEETKALKCLQKEQNADQMKVHSGPDLPDTLRLSRPLEIHDSQRIRSTDTASIEIRVPFLHIQRIANIKGKQDPCHDKLDLVGGEEPARTRVLPEPEGSIFLCDRGELVLLTVGQIVGVRGILLGAQIVESIGIKRVGVCVVLGIMEHGETGRVDERAGWDAGAVFEGDGLSHVALEGIWSGVSDFTTF